ncbi:hypothetical protein DMN91_004681 [Ooceraea biroi]|uniref:Uncharacterized protein n=1 Tax=Ooceraea biroi TaxID=2015173 RepID=A0A3L8DQ92_OOCBI|nr:uncharacterized protein LOC105279122 [Ooceraea biroi]RLU22403.1 hypothetical protein DMN91_004681 [Ooceraea biroi]
MTFISKRLAQNLRCKRVSTSVLVSAVGGVPAGTFNKAVIVAVSPRDSVAPSFSTTAVIMPHLTSYAPKHVIDLDSFSYLSGLRWADPNPGNAESIDLILGADLYGCVLLEGIRKGDIGDPIAQNSVFGWVLSGPVNQSTTPNASPHSVAAASHSAVTVHHSSASLSLDNELRRFWEIEEVPRKPILTSDESKCERHFAITHSRADDGRYIVRLPFRTNPPIAIGESKRAAERQIASLSRQMQANPTLFKEYSAFLDEYESLGHMRRAPRNDLSVEPRVYFPHHPVFRESSSTSRLRVVFNASSRTSNGTSLNDHLLPGPKLQSELPSVLLK